MVGIKQLAAATLQNTFALRLGWDRQLKHHVKAANEGGIETSHGVGHPQCGHRVLLQHPVDPRLAQLGGALAPEEAVAIVEDVFDLVKSDQCLLLRKETLCGTKSPEAVFSIDRVTVCVFAGDFEQLIPHLLGQGPRQLALARSWRAVQEDVHAAPPSGHGIAQIGAQNLQRGLNMAVVCQAQLSGASRRHGAAQQADRVGFGGSHQVSKPFREQIQLVAQCATTPSIHHDQPRPAENACGTQRGANVWLGQIKNDGQGMNDLDGRQIAQPLRRVIEEPLVMNGYRELQHLAVDGTQPHQVGQLINVVAQES